MKVLQIGKFYPPYVGGMEFFSYDLTEELNKQGVKADVLCANDKNEYEEEIINGYKVIRVASLFNFFSTPIAPKLIRKIREIQSNYDIIHIHLPNPIANLALFLSDLKSKIIVHWHSDIIKQKILLKFYEPFQNWLLKKANFIIATSPNYAKNSKYLKNYKNKVKIIPLGINPLRLSFSEERISKIKKDYNSKPKILSVGRFVYYKGYEYLIEAMRYIDAYLFIVGSGTLNEKLKKLVEKFNLNEKVILVGEIPEGELGNYYKMCDVFCLASIAKSEAFGLVQVEAMSFGKPIVSTNIPGSGVSWVNQHEKTGLIVEPKNPKALAKAIWEILKKKDKYNFYSENAKKRFKENFHIEIIARKIINLYEKTL